MTALSLFHPQDTGQSAVISPDRKYRYALERRWGSGPFVLFVMLNPSTADEHVDDPTLRRCIGFGKAWGFGGLLVGNLFALRSTDPRELAKAHDPVGPDADVWLTTMAMRAGLVVAAWGAHAFAQDRARQVVDSRVLGNFTVLGLTKAGHPRHPLYAPGSCVPLNPLTLARASFDEAVSSSGSSGTER